MPFPDAPYKRLFATARADLSVSDAFAARTSEPSLALCAPAVGDFGVVERHEKLRTSLRLILSLSSTRAGVTFRELMAEHDLGLRTLQRMLRAIEHIYGPLEEVPSGQREKRWRLSVTTPARGMPPTAGEVAEVEFAAQQLQQQGLSERAALLRSVAARIKGGASADVLRRIEPDIEAQMTSEGIAARPGPTVVLPPAALERLRRSILSSTRIRLHYRRADGAARWHTLEPYGLLYGERPYLLALKPGKPDVAVWRLDRIQGIAETDVNFVPRAGCDIRSLTAGCFGIWREAPFDVELRFMPAAAADAQAWRFHSSQTQERCDDGSLVVRFRAGGLGEMVHHLVAWGDAVQVREPPALRQRLADAGRLLLAHHGGSGDPWP